MNVASPTLNKNMRRKFDRVRSLAQIQKMDPVEFEYFIGYLFEKEGYQVSQYGADGQGVYLMLRKGIQTIMVQCLLPGRTVSETTVQQLYDTMWPAGADQAIVVTSGAISPSAAVWAAGKPITLMDGRELESRVKQMQAASRPGWVIPAILAGVAVIGLLVCLVLGALAAGPVQEALAGLRAQNTVPPVPTIPAGVTEEVVTNTPGPTITAPPLGAPTITRPAPAGTIAVPFIAAAPSIDGSLSDWPAVPAYVSAYRVFSADGWDGSDDLEATWQLGWMAAGLYIGVTVLDDVHVQTQTGRVAYQGDSLELQIDTDVEGDYGPGVSEDDFQFLLSPGDFAGNGPSAYRFQGDAGLGFYRDAEGFQIVVAAQPTAGGYTLEAFIPWSDMNLTPQAGMVMGVSLNATDTDTPNAAIQEVMYATSNNRRHTDPTTWGPFVLEGGQ